MTTSDYGREKIEAFEGCVLKAYKARPAEKYWTIGYGHYGPDVKEGDVITKERADELFKQDLKARENAVNALGMDLNQWQFDALVDFAYNCGIGALQTVCKSKDLGVICQQIPNWCKDASGQVLQGLVTRRAWEVSMISPGTIKRGKCIADCLNIRSKAGMDGSICGSYHEGDDIEILDEWIQTPRGWVASRYVQQ